MKPKRQIQNKSRNQNRKHIKSGSRTKYITHDINTHKSGSQQKHDITNKKHAINTNINQEITTTNHEIKQNRKLEINKKIINQEVKQQIRKSK